MSDIQAIIKLIEEGSSNSDHRDGQRQINEAVAMLRRMQEDSHLHSGQRWELSQILGCGPLYKDIEKAVKGMKETRSSGQWQPIEDADKEDGVSVLAYDETEVNDEAYGYIHQTYYSLKDGLWHLSCSGRIWNPTYFIPIPKPPSLA